MRQAHAHLRAANMTLENGNTSSAPCSSSSPCIHPDSSSSPHQALVRNARQVHVHGSLRRPALPHYGYLTAYATLPFRLASIPPEP